MILAFHLFRKLDDIRGRIVIDVGNRVGAERGNVRPHAAIAVNQNLHLLTLDEIRGGSL